jgi:hypothetical protein
MLAYRNDKIKNNIFDEGIARIFLINRSKIFFEKIFQASNFAIGIFQLF